MKKNLLVGTFIFTSLLILILVLDIIRQQLGLPSWFVHLIHIVSSLLVTGWILKILNVSEK